MSGLVDIASGKLDPRTNTVLVQAKSEQIGSTEDDAPGFDSLPVFGSLGVVAVPWPKDERGNAQAINDESLPGHNGAITSIRDLRAAKVVQELGPGETAICSTGPDFDSVVFLKKQMLALMVGDDMAFVMDRDGKKITLTAFGCVFEMSAAQGVTITSGGATSQWFGPVQSHMGQVVLGGRVPSFQIPYLAVPSVPLVGTPGPQGVNTGLPALGVFIGV